MIRIIRGRNQAKLFVVEMLVILAACLFLYPFFLVFINTFKSYADILTNVVDLPKSLLIDNYIQVWELIEYPELFLNTLFLTAFSVLGIWLFGAMAGYKLCRTKSKWSSFLFILCIAPMMLPFQSFMITLTQLAKQLHLINHLPGLSVVYWGLGCPLAIFLFHGFVKSIPIELEECAAIDGLSGLPLFFKIVLPIMKPVTSTVVILNAMWIWNDFLLPLIMLHGSASTLQLASYKFFGMYSSEWQYALTAVVLTTLPPMLFFLFMQKYMIRGMMAGAVKG
ncbi:carbohydrate ABC transporter permease [Paenibacillus turpanensis]|uniref:carbohydrate ABC transporter permease n=1 Tax=Paenibacillus turpanensis TaxID=2689078 RepID=UPI0014075640|nr:carbohydrate ABC transporter permease [Paenibacillus turpanensis]